VEHALILLTHTAGRSLEIPTPHTTHHPLSPSGSVNACQGFFHFLSPSCHHSDIIGFCQCYKVIPSDLVLTDPDFNAIMAMACAPLRRCCQRRCGRTGDRVRSNGPTPKSEAEPTFSAIASALSLSCSGTTQNTKARPSPSHVLLQPCIQWPAEDVCHKEISP